VLDEAQTTFPSRPTPCVLSLGPGLIDIVESKKSPLVLQKNSIKHIGRAGEEASEEIANQFLQEGLFFRFNVDRGIQMTSLTDWKRLGDVKAHTMHYMAQKGVGIRLDRLVALISGEGTSLFMNLPCDICLLAHVKQVHQVSHPQHILHRATIKPLKN